MTPTPCLSPDQVAELLACGVDHVYDLLNAGDLQGARIGSRRWAIPVPAYEAFLAERMGQAS